MAVASLREALGGMQKVEHEIIDQVRALGGKIDSKNFSWNHGRSLAELPSSAVHMEVRVGSRQAAVDWSRLQLEDSWDRVDRSDVRAEIEHIVGTLVQ